MVSGKLSDARKLVETKRLIMGVHEVFGTLYEVPKWAS